MRPRFQTNRSRTASAHQSHRLCRWTPRLKPGHTGKGFTLFDVKRGLYDLNQTIDLYERPDGKGTLSVR